ncbi:MAG: PAS domain S-box protein [Methylococcales bacterium]|nr:PAS domain S-box protein [Methylococcales bacterium]
METDKRTRDELLSENAQLRLQLEEAKDIRPAISSGEVDAPFASLPEGEQIFTLKAAEHPYRVLVETMKEGAVFISQDGMIVYCNKPLSELLQVPMERLIGSSLAAYATPEDHAYVADLLENPTRDGCRKEITLKTGAGNDLPVLFSCSVVELEGKPGVGVVVTDIRAIKEAQRQITNAAVREEIGSAIQENEEWLRLALNAAKMCLFDWDVTLDKITWSQRSKELFGFCSGEFGGTYAEFASLVHPEDLPRVEEAIARSKTGRAPYVCEYRFVQPDGRVRWLLARGDFAYDGDGQPSRMRGTVVDITERKQTEEELCDCRKRIQLALEVSHSFIFEWNPATDQVERTPGFGSILGLPFEKARFDTGQCYFQRIHPDDRERFLTLLDNLTPDADSYHTEYRLIRSDGEEAFVAESAKGIFDAEGRFLRLVGALMDITEQKRTEQSLREAETYRVSSIYARSLIETSPDPLIMISPDGKISDVNAATESVTGYPRNELIGTGFEEYFTDPMMARTGYREAFKSGMMRDYELEIRHRDGHLTSVLCNAAVYGDETGKLKGVFAAVRDITQRKSVETELANSHNFLIEIINTLPLRVFWKDRNLRYLGCNTSFAHDAGMGQAADVIGKDDNQMGWSYPAGLYQADDRAVIESGISKLNVEEPRTTLSGQSIWLRTSKVPLRNQDNEIIGLLGIYDDITECKRAKDKLDQLMREQQAMLDNELVGIVRSRDRRIVWDNKAMERIFGYGPGELDGQPGRILYPDDALYQVQCEAAYAMINAHGSCRVQVEMVRKDDEKIWIDLNGARLSGTNDEFLWLLSDITPIKKYQDKIEQIALHDDLTGLPNRLLVSDRLNLALAQAARAEQSLAVCYLDLDGFKSVNDSFGHAAGDKLLIEIAHRLQTSVRANDTVGRLGGDEFVLLLTNLENAKEVYEVLQRVMEAIKQPVVVDETHAVTVTASIGIALFPQDSINPDTLLRHADQAMYVAKDSGKNRYFLFNIEQDATLKAEQGILADILSGISRHEFVLSYQPKVNMKTGAVIGAEALIRWQHPELGLLLPADFLPIVENHPCGIELGEWVIDAAFAQLAQWHEQNFDIPVSVNIGAHHFQQDNFVPGMRERFAAHPAVQPGRIELEIVESSALEDLNKVLKTMQACSEIGLQFALDDYGTGYSSLTYLKRLPVNILKIDQSFVRDMLNDPEDLSIIEGVIGLAKAFHYQVIAEGVETASHGERLLTLGCDLAQGYAIAWPMLGAELPGWVATWQRNAAGLGRRDRAQNLNEC